MSQYHLNKSILKGEITIPSSKSHTLRAILFASLAKGKSVIHRYLPSSDTQAMVQACRNFGAELNVSPDRIEVQGVSGKIAHTEDVIQAGNSGIVLRFCSAIGALSSHPVVVTGDYSIRHHRPMKQLIQGLTQLGVSVTSMRGDGYAPLIIQGPIKPGLTSLSGEDSQPVSALLIAAAFAEGPIEIQVQNSGEKPWVALTLNWLDRLGIPYENEGFEKFSLYGKTQYSGFEYTVPGDFSSAAFPVAAALVTNSEITIRNIDMQDAQGDKELIHVFKKMGALIEMDEKKQTLHVRKGGNLSGISIDINNFVDAITILAVVGCYSEGETRIRNAAVARQKECNRIECLITELRKMGGNITETSDGLIIQKSSLKANTNLHSHQDHRMAMSLAVAALGTQGESTITSVECVGKTFPSFVSDFQKLGAVITEVS